MKMLTSFLKITRLGRLLSVLLIGTLILFSSFSNTVLAGTQDPNQGASNPLDRRFYEEKILDKSSDPANTNPGQMYPYSDVDPRRDDRQVNAEAEKLTREARRNTDKKSFNAARNTKRVLDERPESLEQVRRDTARAGKQLSRKAERGLSEFGDRTAQRAENLKENAKSTAENIPKIVGDTADRAKSKVTADKSNFFKDRAGNS